MANSVNDFFVEAALESIWNNVGGTVTCTLLTSAYTYDPAAHDFYDDVTPAARVAAQAMTNPVATITATGTVALDADDVTFVAVPAGSTVTQIVIWDNTGVESTSRILIHADTITNFPFLTSGGDVTVTFSSGVNRIAALVA